VAPAPKQIQSSTGSDVLKVAPQPPKGVVSKKGSQWKSGSQTESSTRPKRSLALGKKSASGFKPQCLESGVSCPKWGVPNARPEQFKVPVKAQTISQYPTYTGESKQPGLSLPVDTFRKSIGIVATESGEHIGNWFALYGKIWTAAHCGIDNQPLYAYGLGDNGKIVKRGKLGKRIFINAEIDLCAFEMGQLQDVPSLPHAITALGKETTLSDAYVLGYFPDSQGAAEKAELHVSHGAVTSAVDGFGAHLCSTEAGVSGAPIFAKHGGNLVLVGVHIGYDSDTGYNVLRWLSSDLRSKVLGAPSLKV
jgi:hypothetical protein